VELEQEQEPALPNWGGYDYPLACRMLKQTDAFHLYPVMKKSAMNLSGFIYSKNSYCKLYKKREDSSIPIST
jgi:hypothetical protein